MERDRNRQIEILRLTNKISAELDSGEVEELDDGQLAGAAVLLIPPPKPPRPNDEGRVASI